KPATPAYARRHRPGCHRLGHLLGNPFSRQRSLTASPTSRSTGLANVLDDFTASGGPETLRNAGHVADNHRRRHWPVGIRTDQPTARPPASVPAFAPRGICYGGGSLPAGPLRRLADADASGIWFLHTGDARRL